MRIVDVPIMAYNTVRDLGVVLDSSGTTNAQMCVGLHLTGFGGLVDCWTNQVLKSLYVPYNSLLPGYITSYNMFKNAAARLNTRKR